MIFNTGSDNLPNDFLGTQISVGDDVVFRLSSYRGLLKGKVIFIDHKIHVELDTENWLKNRPYPVSKVVHAISQDSVYKI